MAVQLTRRSVIAASAAASMSAATGEVRLGRKLRVGIIGTVGHPGEITGPLARLPEVEVVAVAEEDQAALARFLKNPRLANARGYSNYRELLDKEKLDIAAVCNNNGERAGAILAAIDRKLDVIAEKPLAITRESFNKVRQAVDSSKIKLGMLLPMRFDSPYLAMRQAVEKGLIGEVAQIGAQKSYQSGDRVAWFKKKETYGSTILWIGIHMFDLMRFTSRREFTQAAGFRGHVAFPEIGDMDNVTSSMFLLDNGGVGTLRMDYLRPMTAGSHGDDRLRLAGTDGVIEYQAATGVTLMNKSLKPHKLETLPPRGSVFIDFLESSYAGKPAALPLSDIYRVCEITLAAHEAAEQGRIVRI